MSSSKFNHVEYKKRQINTWNEIAPRYHKRWAKNKVSPFKSTSNLIEAAQIQRGYKVLDLACGTGLVTRHIEKKIGKKGHVIGIDASRSAIKIAQRISNKKNVDFVLADAENFNFNCEFDAITCQYALFFFPNADQVLKKSHGLLRKNGTMAVAVHGSKNTVPYFSSILDIVTKFIPDYLPKNAPSLDRFGTKKSLKNVLTRAGFQSIQVNQYCYYVNVGTFEKYWNDYLRYLAKPLKEKIYKISIKERRKMRDQVEKKTIPYTKNDRIIFPWNVLIASAAK